LLYSYYIPKIYRSANGFIHSVKCFDNIDIFTKKKRSEIMSKICLKNTGNDENISDEGIVEIRDNFYGLTEVAIEGCIKERNTKAVKIL